MKIRPYNFESWKCNEGVYPPEIGESCCEHVPIHVVLTSKNWREQLITGKYIEQKEIEKIHLAQKKVLLLPQSSVGIGKIEYRGQILKKSR